MGDSSSPIIFSTAMEELAKAVISPHSFDPKEMAQKLWQLSRQFDFSDDEMECDEALKVLGLARDADCSDCEDCDPDDCATIQYRTHDGKGWQEYECY